MTISLVQLALDARYRRLFTIEPTLVDPLHLGVLNGRITVDPDDSPLEFFLKIHGAYRWNAWRKEFHRMKESANNLMRNM